MLQKHSEWMKTTFSGATALLDSALQMSAGSSTSPVNSPQTKKKKGDKEAKDDDMNTNAAKIPEEELSPREREGPIFAKRQTEWLGTTLGGLNQVLGVAMGELDSRLGQVENRQKDTDDKIATIENNYVKKEDLEEFRAQWMQELEAKNAE